MNKPTVRAVKATLAATAVSASMLVPTGASQAAPVATAASPSTPYTPQTGLVYNNPLRRESQQVVLNTFLNTIRSAPSGSTVRVSDWNIQNQAFVNVAKAANDRGVKVQVLMSRGVAKRQNPTTGSYGQLASYFHAHRVSGSWIYACASSCRGTTGIEHAKFLTVDRVGEAQDVVMVSSANMTGIAGVNQWNDLFTVAGDPALYEKFSSIFDRMRLDRPDTPMYQTFRSGTWEAFFNPHASAGEADPVVRDLNQVRCGNAGAGAGVNGRTAIRVAQTAISGDRGLRIGNKLASLRRQGCNIKVVYTLLGSNVRRTLVGAGVPTRQLTRDLNRDGYYDKYLHTKLLTISGNFQGRPGSHFVRNGSENWNPTAFQSDESGLQIYDRPGYETAYARYINWMFSMGHTSVQSHPVDRGPDPYANVQID